MAPFSIPAPSIIPLRLPIFGGPKSIDTNTKVQLLCETFLDHEIFYTLDGTKPQPYAGIVQGNKTIKYLSPFCLPPGKVTMKAIAINANIHTMCSNIVTKCFEVLKVDSPPSANMKQSVKSKQEKCDIRPKGSKKSHCHERTCAINKFNSDEVDCNENNVDCLENAFIDTVELELENFTLDDTVDGGKEFNTTCDTFDDCVSDNSGCLEESGGGKSYSNISGIANLGSVEDDAEMSSFEGHEKAAIQGNEDYSMFMPNAGSNITNSQSSGETQFCCLKCNMTLQQCSSCQRMNAVSSKFCIECGTQLIRICCYCKQHNPSIATFCQSCGKKLLSAAVKLDFSSTVDSYVMAKPNLRNAGTQHLPVLEDKSTQTSTDKTFTKKTSSKNGKKEKPPHSPGRGYWHLQLDYICNNLKSHAYNNLEFRKTISDPTLCNFKSAHVTKDEENVTVTVVFSTLFPDKCNSSEAGEIKSKGSS